jgi:cytoskeleton protein RodZ
MSSVGETLRRERLRTGLDLERISQDTKISVRMLEQIEANQFHKLPGGVFARSFVRQYARAVGLDQEEVVAELERTLVPAAEFEQAPAAAVEDAPKPGIRLPRVPSFDTTGRKSSTLPALALVVLVMLGCSVAYTWWQQKSRHITPVAAQVEETAVPAKAPETAPAQMAANPPSTPAESAVRPPGSPATAAIETSTGALHIALTAEEPTWVQAKANGKVVFSGVIQANETKSLQAGDTVTLRVGNAGGVSISLNGKAIPALGPKGQVRVVQLTPDGAVQPVDPPKPVAPPQQTL